NILNPDKSLLTPGAVHVHDLQATILQALGIDHQRLTYFYQGRHFRLTDVHGHVINDLLTCSFARCHLARNESFRTRAMPLARLISFCVSFLFVALTPGLCMTLAMSLGIS